MVDKAACWMFSLIMLQPFDSFERLSFGFRGDAISTINAVIAAIVTGSIIGAGACSSKLLRCATK